jgi:hypothetical protein
MSEQQMLTQNKILQSLLVGVVLSAAPHPCITAGGRTSARVRNSEVAQSFRELLTKPQVRFIVCCGYTLTRTRYTAEIIVVLTKS